MSSPTYRRLLVHIKRYETITRIHFPEDARISDVLEFALPAGAVARVLDANGIEQHHKILISNFRQQSCSVTCNGSPELDFIFELPDDCPQAKPNAVDWSVEPSRIFCILSHPGDPERTPVRTRAHLFEDVSLRDALLEVLIRPELIDRISAKDVATGAGVPLDVMLRDRCGSEKKLRLDCADMKSSVNGIWCTAEFSCT